MKTKLFILLFLLVSIFAQATTYYVKPTGNDGNTGLSDAQAWATWGKAFTGRSAGDIVYFRGGVYNMTVLDGSGYSATINGTITDTIFFLNYPGETPILDCSNVTGVTYNENHGCELAGSYFKVSGLTIRHVHQIHSVVPAELCYAWLINASNTVFYNCTAYSTNGSGFFPYGTNLYFINCDSYDNNDSLTQEGHMPGNNGYGFFHYRTSSGGSIYYWYCRAWHCSDDGWAVCDNSYIEWNGCWAFLNGALEGAGDGFKIGFLDAASDGTLIRVVKNCISAFNHASGLTTNDNGTYWYHCHVYNNIMYHNGYIPGWWVSSYGFILYDNTGTQAQQLLRDFKNNISYDNEDDNWRLNGYATHDHNDWDIPLTVTDADFVSVDTVGLTLPRNADGSLPDQNGFLHLATGSDLIDAGTDVGNGNDLGAYQYGVIVGPPGVGIKFLKDSNGKYLKDSKGKYLTK